MRHRRGGVHPRADARRGARPRGVPAPGQDLRHRHRRGGARRRAAPAASRPPRSRPSPSACADRASTAPGDVRSVAAELRPQRRLRPARPHPGRADRPHLPAEPAATRSCTSTRRRRRGCSSGCRSRCPSRACSCLGKAEMLLTHSRLFAPRDLRAPRSSRGRTSGRPAAACGLPRDAPLLSRSRRPRSSAPPRRSWCSTSRARSRWSTRSASTAPSGSSRATSAGRSRTSSSATARSSCAASIEEAEPHARGRRGQGRRAWAATGRARWFDVQVVPLLDGTEGLLGVQITFRDVTRYHALDRPAGRRRTASSRRRTRSCSPPTRSSRRRTRSCRAPSRSSRRRTRSCRAPTRSSRR